MQGIARGKECLGIWSNMCWRWELCISLSLSLLIQRRDFHIIKNCGSRFITGGKSISVTQISFLFLILIGLSMHSRLTPIFNLVSWHFNFRKWIFRRDNFVAAIFGQIVAAWPHGRKAENKTLLYFDPRRRSICSKIYFYYNTGLNCFMFIIC